MSEVTQTPKNENSILGMVKLGLILAVYAVVSCAVLALVNNFTSPKILENSIKKATAAMKEVFVEADDFEKIDDFAPASTNTITLSDAYLAKENGRVIGAVIQVAGPTYDKGKIILGIRTDGLISGLRFLELTDSPGFGSKAKDPNYTVKSGKTFYEQFALKDAGQPFVNNQNFDGISGATITSNSVATLINQGAASLLKYFAEHDLGGKNE